MQGTRNHSASFTLHQRLRRATAAPHARVEAAFDFSRVTTELPAYCRALTVLEAAISGAHEALVGVLWQSWRPNLMRLAERRRCLRDDLRDLGTERAHPASELKLASAGEGIGCLYVIEGSALGGLVIYTAAHRNLGVTAAFAGRYFHGLGKQTISEWQAFLDQMNAEPAASRFGDEAEIGARRTFELFAAALAAVVPAE